MGGRAYRGRQILSGGTLLPDHAVLVRDGDIEAVVPAGARLPNGMDAEDWGNVVIVPGTVNTHTHSFQSLVRGFSDDLPFFRWRDEGIYRIAPFLGPEEIYAGALLSFGEMLRSGVTTVSDFFYVHAGGNDNDDGLSSNNRASVFDEMRTAALLQKVAALDGSVLPAETALAMGTRNGGVVLGLPVGEIAPGFRADLVALNLGDLSLQPPGPVDKHLVYAMHPGAITRVVVAGTLVVKDGRLLTVPEDEIAARVGRVTEAWQGRPAAQ